MLVSFNCGPVHQGLVWFTIDNNVGPAGLSVGHLNQGLVRLITLENGRSTILC